MRPGDLVRFLTTTPTDDPGIPAWNHGLLIEYQTWEKIARILYCGKIVSIHASQVQLAKRNKEEI